MRIALLLTLTLLIGIPSVSWATPATISYQGMLRDSTGQLVTDGSYMVTFSMFNAVSGGSALWAETQSVTTQDGLFSTTLGQVSAIPDTAMTDTAAYLQIAVDPDPPMSPRTRLSSAPYSLVSSSVRGDGPVHLEVKDQSSGGTSHYEISVSPPSAGSAGQARKSCSLIMPDASASLDESLDLASGHVTNVYLQDGDDTLSFTEIAHLPGPPVAQTGAAVAIPAFMKNARKAKTAEAAESREILDIDSGFAHRVTLQSASGTTEKTLELAPPTAAAIAIPNLIEARKGSNESASAETRLIVDPDSGYYELAMVQADTISSFISSGTNHTREHVLLGRQVSLSGGGGRTRQLTLVTEQDSTGLLLKCESETGNISEARKGANESAAISALRTIVTTHASRAVTTTDTAGCLLELESDNTTSSGENSRATIRCVDLGPVMSMGLATPTDTSDVEMSVTDTEQSITLSTTTSATKWPNIVLKRGLTASEMTISHVSAGPTSVIHASVDGAIGAQLGINTATPTLAFQLVGSGCYSGTFGACSDRRFKDQISTLSDPLTTVRQLRGVNFNWRQEEFPEHEFPEGEQLGLIAQEVESVLPSVVSTGSDGYKSVDYAKLVPLLIEAVKDQQRQIDLLKARLDIATQ